MGLIKAVTSAVGTGLGDQWLEVIESGEMSDTTVFVKGRQLRAEKGSNRKGSGGIVTDGSTIHVLPNQFMMLLDGGKVVDYTAEEGYYTVQNSSQPSVFNGQFGDALKETFNRIKYGGVTPQKQEVYFINLQEIKGIKFGTPNALNYFDSFYNAELFVRAHGTYSIKVTNPLLFYSEALPKDRESVDINDINEQYLSEFLQGFSAALNRMSAEGERISFLASKGPELAAHMQTVLDEDWNKSRGFEIDHVGVSNISYDEESQKLINMRNQGSMFADPGVREGFVQSAVASGMQAAGSNTAGAGQAFMGMGMGMNAAGAFMGASSNANLQQMQMQNANAANTQAAAAAGAVANDGWFCTNCGEKNAKTAKFCGNCGTAAPAASGWTCANCGTANEGNFCSNCGNARS